MIHSRGTLILFADADGATTFDDLEKLEDNVTQNMVSCPQFKLLIQVM